MEREGVSCTLDASRTDRASTGTAALWGFLLTDPLRLDLLLLLAAGGGSLSSSRGRFLPCGFKGRAERWFPRLDVSDVVTPVTWLIEMMKSVS